MSASSPAPEPQDAPPPGTILGGQYQVVKLLGQGGMGSVVLATDLVLGRDVAMKLLKEEVAVRVRGSARFRREARLLSRLSHPNVVTIHAFGTDDAGTSYIVMEYVRGHELAGILRRDGPLPPELFARVIVQAGNGLAAAHETGIVHRDLKPGNILVASVPGEPHLVKVVDFGLAKTVDEEDAAALTGADGEPLTIQGMAVGTPVYISPEQARSMPVDARSDIYSLAVVACHLLTGRTPFEGGTAFDLLVAHVTKPPRLPSELRPDLGFRAGGPVDRVLARALAKDPAERHQDVREFAEEIAAAVLSEAGLATPSRVGAALAPVPRSASAETASAFLSADPSEQRAAVLVLELDDASPSAEASPAERHDCLAVVAARIRQAVLDARGLPVEIAADRAVAVFVQGPEGEPPVEACLRAAVGARAALAALEHDPTLPAGLRVAFRCGVDLGPLLLGGRGKEGVLAFGPALLSARDLARRAGPREIRGSAHAARLARGAFEWASPAASGAGEGSVCVRRKSVVRPPRESEVLGVEVALQGREAELAHLEAALDTAVGERTAGAVLLSGPPGVGKSRLVGELLGRIEERCYVEEGRSSAGGEALPYEPFVQAIRARARIDEQDGRDEVAARLEHFVRVYLADGPAALEAGETRLVEALREMVGGLGEARETGQTADLQGDHARRTALFEHVAAVYRRLATKHPLVVVLDDFQWAGAPTRALLGFLLRRLRDLPVLFVVVTRDDGFEAAAATLHREGAAVEHLSLQPLDDREAERLVRHVLRRLVEVPAPLVRRIRELAQGLPLVVEESVHDLVDAGIVEVDGERWSLAPERMSEVALPRTVGDLLTSRVRRLPREHRAVLEAAAVAGPRFWPALLEALAGPAWSAAAFVELERRGLFVLRREMALEGANDYAFTQLALREAVYREVPAAEKRRLHGLAAGWLLERTGGGPSALDGAIGAHLERSGSPVRALEPRRRAAQRAGRLHASEEALEHLEACLRLLASAPDEALAPGVRLATRVEVVSDLVRHASLVGRLRRADELASALFADREVRARMPPARLAPIALAHGWALLYLGRYRDALAAFDLAASLVRAAGAEREPLLALQAATGRASMTARLGDAPEGARLAREAIDAFEGPPTGAFAVHLSNAWRTLGMAEATTGAREDAMAAFEKAYALAKAANAPESLVDALNARAGGRYFAGDLDGAARDWSAALEIAERWDLLTPRAMLLNNLGELAWSRGDLASARSRLDRAVALGRFVGSDETLADAHRLLAEIHLAESRPDDAVADAESALAAATRVGSPGFLAPAHRVLGQALRAAANGAGATPPPDALDRAARHLDLGAAAFDEAGLSDEAARTRALV